MTTSPGEKARRPGVGRPAVVLLGAICLAAAPAKPGGPANPATPASAAPPAGRTEAAAPPAVRAAAASPVERHSPFDGYPSLGPAGAENTLVFFTDYQ